MLCCLGPSWECGRTLPDCSWTLWLRAFIHSTHCSLQAWCTRAYNAPLPWSKGYCSQVYCSVNGQKKRPYTNFSSTDFEEKSEETCKGNVMDDCLECCERGECCGSVLWRESLFFLQCTWPRESVFCVPLHVPLTLSSLPSAQNKTLIIGQCSGPKLYCFVLNFRCVF